jgi:hypothetical protein
MLRRAFLFTAILILASNLPRVAADPPAVPGAQLMKTAAPAIWMELYTERKAFEERLGKLTVVDFDDVDTTATDVVPFAADRYRKSHGVVITGTDGQYSGRTFGYPNDYVPVSKPNSYAPGPKSGQGKDEGGFETVVTFSVGEREGAVAGFGAVFIDCDYPRLGPSALAVAGPDGKELASVKGFSGSSGSQLFRGMIAVNDAGRPVAIIRRVTLHNGNGWPASSSAEGVTLDDFIFTPPAAAGTLMAQAPPAPRPTNGPLVTRPATDPLVSRPVNPSATNPPTPGTGEAPSVARAPQADKALDLLLAAYKPGDVSADTRTALAAMLKGDVEAGRTALARANDRHGRALRLAAGLLDSPMIDPFSLIAYTFDFHEPSAAFLPNGKADPVGDVTAACSLAIQVDPELKPYFADAVKTMCVVQLINNLRAGRPVGLSDDILFSSVRVRPRPRDPRSSGDQKRYGPLPDANPLPKKDVGAVSMLEALCSDPEDRKRYLGKVNAPRYWFLERNFRKDGYFLCTGLWYNAMAFADKIDPDSCKRWDGVFHVVATAYAEKGGYTSALIVKMLSGSNPIPFLANCGQQVDAKDEKKVTNLVIALGYFLEATRGKWTAGLKGTDLGKLHDKLATMAKPADLDLARRCGELSLATFEMAP